MIKLMDEKNWVIREIKDKTNFLVFVESYNKE